MKMRMIYRCHFLNYIFILNIQEQDEVGSMEGLPKAEILERPNWNDELRALTYVDRSVINVTQEV